MASFAMYMQHKQRTLFPLSHVTFSANFLAASEVDQIHSRKKEVLSCSQDFIFGGWSSQTVQRRDVLPALRTGITISKFDDLRLHVMPWSLMSFSPNVLQGSLTTDAKKTREEKRK
jgi:hypothetical protein